MAYINQLTQGNYAEVFFANHQRANKYRNKEIAAAIKIQSWIRSAKTRDWIKRMHKSATILQKEFKGFVVRKRYRKKVSNQLKSLMREYYDQEATKIQTIWRGYATRKFKANYYKQKEFLKGLQEKNKLTLEMLKACEYTRKIEEAEKRRKTEGISTVFKLRRTHYLLSTCVRSGVYNGKRNPSPDIEAALKAVSPLSSSEREMIHFEKREKHLRSAVGIPFANDDKNARVEEKQPVDASKPQGPFRKPEEVREQRMKAFRPTLRVETDYDSAELARGQMYRNECAKRIIDVKFIPSQKIVRSIRGPTLRTTACYKNLPYGSQHFRECGQGSGIHGKPFHSVLPPIPLFDQFGKTY